MTTIRTRARWALCGMVALSAAACGQGLPEGTPEARDLTAPEANTAGQPVVTGELPFDLDEVVAQARISFREDGAGGYVTTQPTHAIQAKDGLLTFTPMSYSASAKKLVQGLPVELETVAITRDGGDLSQGVGTTEPQLGASVRIDRGVAQEHVYNSAAGIEQTWDFAMEPAGQGPLAVRVAIRGQRYVGVDARGHHFIDEAAQVGLVYSHAVWVDLAGRRTEVPVVFDAEAGELVMTVDAETLASSQYPAVLDPTVSAENGTSGPAITSSAQLEETPVVAFDGTRYFVVWSDFRDSETFDIWGTFVSTGQVVANTTGLLISGALGDQRAPSVAFNGTNYLVVWQDFRRGSSQTDIMGQIVDTTGAAVGGELALSLSGQAASPDVSAAGTTWFAVWEDFRAGANSNVLYTSVTSGGVVADPTALNDNPSNEARPAVACTATTCMAVFSAGIANGEDIYRQRFNAAGLIDTVSATISGPANGRSLLADIAYDGTNYLAVWQDRRSGNWDIYGQRIVAGTGVPLVPQGFVISNNIADQVSPTVAYDGTQYLVAWTDSRSFNTLNTDILAARVQTDGTVTNANGFGVCAQSQLQRFSRVVAGGGQFFLVWEDERLGPPMNIRGTRVTSAGAVPDTVGTQIATAANRQTSAALAHGGATSGQNYLLVYNDTRLNGAANYDLVAMRINRLGANLDPSGRLLTAGTGAGTPGNQIGPEISFNGTSFLVVWQDGRNGTTNYDVYGTLVTISAGGLFTNVNGPNGFLISGAANNQLAPTVAWNAGANRWLVAWGDQRTNSNTDIYGSRIEANGTVVDAAGIAISTAADQQVRPDVASDGTNWLVAWTDRSSGVSNSENVLGSIVAANGTPGASFSVATAANRQEGVRLAYNGTNYIAVWQDNRLSTTNVNILGARVSPAGVLQDANGVNLANSITLSEGRPRVARMGTDVFVVWSQSATAGSVTNDLYGRQFTSALTPVAAAFAISTNTGSETQAAVAVDATNLAALVAYQRYDSTVGVRAERVRYRRVTFP